LGVNMLISNRAAAAFALILQLLGCAITIRSRMQIMQMLW
jgi:hypothetical protein